MTENTKETEKWDMSAYDVPFLMSSASSLGAFRGARCRSPNCKKSSASRLSGCCFERGDRPFPFAIWPPRLGDPIALDPCTSGRMQREGLGVVYAFGFEVTGPLKIGSASSAPARRTSLQAGSPRPLLVIAARFCGSRAAAGVAEELMHERFAERRLALDGAREWFDVCLYDFDVACGEIFCGATRRGVW